MKCFRIGGVGRVFPCFDCATPSKYTNAGSISCNAAVFDCSLPRTTPCYWMVCKGFSDLDDGIFEQTYEAVGFASSFPACS